MIERINDLAGAWWLWMWPMFWQVSVLIVIIAALDLLLRRRLWPQARYALWLLVLVKLILPPGLSLPTSLTSELQPLAERAAKHEAVSREPATPSIGQTDSTPSRNSADLSGVRPAPAADSQARTVDVPPPTYAPPIPVGDSQEPAYQPEPAVQEPARALTAKLSLLSVGMLIWLLGGLVLGLWLIMRFQQLRHAHKQKADHIALPPGFKRILADAANKLKLRRLPDVAFSQTVVCPAVFGVFRPVLLLPKDELTRFSQKDIEHILLHELAHIKRGDLWMHAFYMVLQIIYWFNPLLWCVRRRLQHLRELCCDATVARVLREQTTGYRQTILETARRLLAKPVEPGMGLLGLFEDSGRLLARLNWLQKNTWKHRPLRIVVVFALIAFMSACVLPMAAPTNEQERVASLVETLRHGKASQYARAAKQLGKIGKPAVPALIELLAEDNCWAAEALGEMGPDAEEAVPALIKAVNEGGPGGVRGFSAAALAKIGPGAREAIPALIKAAEDDHWNTRMLAVDALGYLSNGDVRVEQALKIALLDENAKVRDAASKALRRISSDSGSNKEFVVGLGNGVTVELLALWSGADETGRKWWRPDGTPMPQEQYARYENKVEPPGWTNEDYRFEYGYLVRFSPADDVATDTDVTKGQRMSTSYPREDGISAVLVASDRHERQNGFAVIGDINVAAAYGPAKSFICSRGVGGDADMRSLEDGSRLIVSAVRPDSDQPDRVLMVDTTVDVGDLNIKVFYESKDGSIRSAWEDGTMGGPSLVSPGAKRRTMLQTTFRLHSIREEDLKSIIVEYRRFQGATFKNVALRPGIQTTVTAAPIRPERPRQTLTDIPTATTPQYPRREPHRPIAPADLPAPNSPFSVELDNGTGVELLALTRFDGGNLGWWAPDGRPIFMPLTLSDMEHTGSIAAFRLYGPVDSFKAYVGPPRHEIKQIWQAASASDNTWLAVLGYPQQRNFGILYISTKAAPRQIVFTIPLTIEDLKAGRTVNQFGVSKIQSFKPLGPGQFAVELLHNDKLAGDTFAARDRSGNTHEFEYGYSTANRSYMRFGLAPEELTGIVRLEKPNSAVIFRNVSLRGKRTRVVVEQPEKAPTAQPVVIDPRLTATLPNGVRVTPVALARLTGDVIESWTPQGRLTDLPAVLECDVEAHALALAYRVEGAAGFVPYLPGEDGLTKMEDYQYLDSTGLWLVELTPPANQTVTGFTVRARGGQPTTVLEIPLGEKDLGRQKNIGAHGYLEVTEFVKRTPESFTVTITHAEDRTRGEFLAIDKQGRAHGRTAGSFRPGSSMLTFPISAEQLSRIVLGARQIGEATFGNISLKPGQETQVRIETRLVDSIYPTPEDAASADGKAEDKPAAEKNRQANESRLSAKLPNGVTIRFVAFGNSSSRGLLWWSPDGRTTTIADVHEADLEGFGKVLAFHLDPPDVDLAAHAYYGRGNTDHIRDVWRPGGSGNIWLVALDDNRRFLNIRLTVYVADPPISYTVPLTLEQAGQVIDVNRCAVSKVSELTPDGPGSFSVRLYWDFSGGRIRTLEPAAVDKSGKTHPLTMVHQYSGSNQRYKADLPIDQLAGIVLRAAEVHEATVHFKNLSLVPEYRTDPQVVVEQSEQ
jgi:beta-lactamase regulating signal transducer with metallopeptidase domain